MASQEMECEPRGPLPLILLLIAEVSEGHRIFLVTCLSQHIVYSANDLNHTLVLVRI